MTQFEALLISWTIEVPLLLALDRFVSRRWRWQALAAGVLATGFTHPLAWQAMLAWYSLWPVFGIWLGLEIAVTLVEMLIYRWLLFQRWRWALVASLLTNLTSALFGLMY